MRITFICGGNMAVALIGGLKKQGFSAAGIQVVEPNADSRKRLVGRRVATRAILDEEHRVRHRWYACTAVALLAT